MEVNSSNLAKTYKRFWFCCDISRNDSITTQTAMDTIALKTKNVPGYVNEVYEILTDEDAEEEDFEDIPLALKAIKRNVDGCKAESAKVVKEFRELKLTLQEMMEAGQSRRGEVEARRANISLDMKSKQMEEKNRQELNAQFVKDRQDQG